MVQSGAVSPQNEHIFQQEVEVRIALLAVGSRGDAQPMVVLGDELRRRGHDTVLVCRRT